MLHETNDAAFHMQCAMDYGLANRPRHQPHLERTRANMSPEPDTPTNTPDFEAAFRFLDQDTGHLFVTGRAGTGKSTLLRMIRDKLQEEAVVVAPTGLAAVNVGGQTIHSFFGFPPRLIAPDDIRRSRNGRVMRKMRFLIIDESTND